jgi:hypothetical protein
MACAIPTQELLASATDTPNLSIGVSLFSGSGALHAQSVRLKINW